MRTIINCTPHSITVLEGEDVILHLAKGDIIPRLTQSSEIVGEICGVPITETVFGETQNLPAEQPDTFLIVSRLVLAANPERKDLVVPNELVRDTEGNIIGCRSLARN